MKRPIVTLTTDFGARDHFVGVMKGVILSIQPAARLVDITHEIPPFSIREGAFAIAQAFPYFPKRTIHVVVVDPGVGTARRPILIEAEGHYFLGPDNGVLSMVYSGRKHKARHISAEKYFLKPVSNTFHGRDIFAPVAAHLAKGVRPAQIGKLIQDHLKTEFARPVRTGKRYWTGSVLHADRFGNLITNFRLEEFPDLRVRPFRMTVGMLTVTRLASNYQEAEPGELVLIPGSTGYLEVATRQGSAAQILKCGAESPVELMIL